MIETNYLAVLVAAIAGMAIGAIWYGPLFGKKWMVLSKMTEVDMANAKAKGMGKSYAIAFVGMLVMACVLNYVIGMANLAGISSGVASGFSSGFWLWLGFPAIIYLGGVLWENKSWRLWLLNASHYLVALLVMGVILGAWQ